MVIVSISGLGLTIMSISCKIPLRNLLTVVFASFVDPSSSPRLIRGVVGWWSPEEVLTLTCAWRVLKFAQLGEVLGPLFGGVGKASVPLQMLEALMGTGRVVDFESGTFVVVHVCVWVVSITEVRRRVWKETLY
jgi:hypothetical protein